MQNWSLAPAPVVDTFSGPMSARFLSSTGLGFGNLIGKDQVLSVSALDKVCVPNNMEREGTMFGGSVDPRFEASLPFSVPDIL